MRAPKKLKSFFQKIGRKGGLNGTRAQKSKAGNASTRARNLKRFATAKISVNAKGVRVITCGCQTFTIPQWAKKLGVPERTLRNKLSNGQPVSKVMIETLG